MAKLVLRFEDSVLKEVPLSKSMITIGRLPDNIVQIDNLAVSGHHAKVYWDANNYFIEDNKSLNGTYLNNSRIAKSVLKHGDQVLIGKHTLVFQEEARQPFAAAAAAAAPVARSSVPHMDATVVLDTRQAKELMAAAKAAATHAAVASAGEGAAAAAPARERIGLLTVVNGKADQHEYLLSGKLTVIGKSEMASIKLKGWFAANVAAVISKRDSKYFIAPQDKGAHVKVNGEEVPNQRELRDGDMVEVSGVKMTFSWGQ